MLHCCVGQVHAVRAFAAPVECPNCADRMVAPLHSEFVESGEIRHYWACEACGETSVTTFEFSGRWRSAAE